MKDANEILEDTQTVHERVAPHLRDGADFFHDHEGTLFTRTEARDKLYDDVGIDTEVCDDVIAQLVSDTVDPVVQVNNHVGVIEFHEFDGAYGYIEYDDVIGKAKRVVCQQCVNEADRDKDVTHATAGDPHGSYGDSADYDNLLAGIHEHYETAHSVVPEDVATGATLASGTTIGGNTAYHSGIGLQANLNANQNDITNVGSVDAEDMNVTNDFAATGLTVSSDPTAPTIYLSHEDGVGNSIENKRVTIPITADGSNHQITDILGTAMINVAGRSSNSRFSDVVNISLGGGTEKISELGGSPNRSYSLGTSNVLEVSISDGGATYNIVTNLVRFNPLSP